MAGGLGAFGKIPSLGDFFRFNLPRSFVEPWDKWLQSGILSCRHDLGEDWTKHYMSAPIWRFSLPSHHAGPQAVSGVLVASVDRVGRHFPLTFAEPIETEDLAAHHFCNTKLFEELEDLALHSLDDAMTRDKLQESLSDKTFCTPTRITVASHRDGTIWRSDKPYIPALAAQSVAKQTKGQGVWSMALDGDHRMMSCSSLPNRNEMLALFDLNAGFWTALTPVHAV